MTNEQGCSVDVGTTLEVGTGNEVSIRVEVSRSVYVTGVFRCVPEASRPRDPGRVAC